MQTVPAARPSPETAPPTPPRFSVVRVGVFEDPIAYDQIRSIYLISDAQTGREFVGVSGIGIAETGSHAAGKGRLEDER